MSYKSMSHPSAVDERIDYRARVDAALVAADIGIWLWDIGADNVRGDPTINAMFGLPNNSDVGRPIAEYLAAIHQDDVAHVSAMIDKVLTIGGDDNYAAEHRVVVAGQERWLSAHGVVRRDAKGAAIDMSGAIVDITSQKTLDAERRSLLDRAESQARVFDTTLSSITDFAYIFDLQGRFLYVNKALLDLWGLPLEQAVGKNFFDLGYPEDLASRLQNQIQQVIDTRQVLTDETPYTSPTGAGGFYEYIFAPVFSVDGAVEVVAGSTRDVSVRKHTEIALRSRTAQFETLLNEAPMGVYLVDADFRVREINPTARPVFVNIPDVIGRDFDEVIHILWPREFADELVRLFRHTLETGEPYITSERIEERLDTQQIEFYEWQINRIPLPDGRHGVVCYFRDISSQVHARRELEIADRQKNEFLAMLAHELRNPLAPIRNSSELLARTLPTDAPSQAAIGVVKRQVSHLTRLVDDLLDVSRISQGRIDLKVEQLEISSVITQAVETVAPLLREKNHDFMMSSSYLPLHVNGDAARLIQCVGNILSNAAKYTDRGGQIRLNSYNEDDHVVISISDNGAGITEELMPRLFDLFVQADRTLDRAEGGLGIGLAIVKRLIEMHGGHVSVFSRGLGTGATFEIRLPLIERAAMTLTQPLQNKAPPRRILIVDDNTDSADSLSMLLRMEDHETEVAYSGLEAIARVEAFHPHLVLLDIGLPELDGYEVARRLQKLPSGEPIHLVALTGYGQSEDRQRALDAGFTDHLVKPVDFAVLQDILAGIADKRLN